MRKSHHFPRKASAVSRHEPQPLAAQKTARWAQIVSGCLMLVALAMSFSYLNCREVLEGWLTSQFDDLSSIYIAYLGWPRTFASYDGTTWSWGSRGQLLVDLVLAGTTILGTMISVQYSLNRMRPVRFGMAGLLSVVGAIATYVAAHEWRVTSGTTLWYAFHDVSTTIVMLCMLWTWHTILSIIGNSLGTCRLRRSQHPEKLDQED